MLNTNGVEASNYISHLIPKEKIDYNDLSNLNEFIREFDVSEWYDLVASKNSRCSFLSSPTQPTATSEISKIKTPYTKFCEYDSNLQTVMDEIIHKYGACFVRLDSASTKNVHKHTNAIETIREINTTDRTREILRTMHPQKYVVREWMDFENCIEMRLFVYDKVVRGVSYSHLSCAHPKNLNKFREIINAYAKKVVHYTDYEDCCIDVAMPNLDSNDIILIEINSPVYALATSGNFDLSIPLHTEILFGPLNEYINYPVIAYEPDNLIL